MDSGQNRCRGQTAVAQGHEVIMAMNEVEARTMLQTSYKHPDCVVQVVPSPFTLHIDPTLLKLTVGWLSPPPETVDGGLAVLRIHPVHPGYLHGLGQERAQVDPLAEGEVIGVEETPAAIDMPDRETRPPELVQKSIDHRVVF